jgi:hypothetical protein
MKMAKISFAFCALAMVLALSGLAFASVNPKVQLVNYSISEMPAQPGGTLVLTLHMKSMEPDNCAENVAVQLSVSYPLSLEGPDTQYIEGLCNRDPDEAGTFVFRLPIDNLATSGTYPVSVTTTYEKRFTQLSESNIVNVRVGGAPAFAASVSSSNPVDIYPGDSAQVTITFVNTGSTPVQSARATAVSRGVEVKWAGETQSMGQIAARGSASATFNIEAPKDLIAGDYPLGVRLEYVSENRSNGGSEFSFIVPVKPKADFGASAPESLLAGQKKEVKITLSNTGSQEARKLQVRIRPLYPFSTDGTVRYVDSLAPGKSTDLTYVITVDKEATTGGQLVGLLIDFEDPQGKKFSDSTDFSLDVKKASLQEEIYAYWYLIALAAVAVVFLVSKRMGKKKAA